MPKNSELQGFTLWELMVWITIISIILIWASNMNFSRSGDIQKLEIETTRIISFIEEKRNNALIWKWVTTSLETPISWTTIIDWSGSWSIRWYYTLENSSTGGLTSWLPPQSFSLNNLECVRLNGTSESITGVIALDFEWSVWYLRWCSDDRFKKIKLRLSKWAISKDITINALTGIIEKN